MKILSVLKVFGFIWDADETDSRCENTDENGFVFWNQEKILSPTLSLRETKQSKGEGDAIRNVIGGV